MLHAAAAGGGAALRFGCAEAALAGFAPAAGPAAAAGGGALRRGAAFVVTVEVAVRGLAPAAAAGGGAAERRGADGAASAVSRGAAPAMAGGGAAVRGGTRLGAERNAPASSSEASTSSAPVSACMLGRAPREPASNFGADCADKKPDIHNTAMMASATTASKTKIQSHDGMGSVSNGIFVVMCFGAALRACTARNANDLRAPRQLP